MGARPLKHLLEEIMKKAIIRMLALGLSGVFFGFGFAAGTVLFAVVVTLVAA